MNFWTVILIVCIVMIVIERNRTVRGLRNHRGEGTATIAEQQPAPRNNPAVERELDDLRERVRVLERIAVDERETKTIAEEIERLRDN